MQSLSKSKLPLKITKIFMVFVLFFSLMIQKPKETHAFPLALLLPAISNPATVTALLGVIGIGAVGVSSKDWYDEKYQELETIAIESLGMMSQDMKSNLQKSIQDLANGFTSGLALTNDVIQHFIDAIRAETTTTDIPLLEGYRISSNNTINLPDGVIIELTQNNSTVSIFTNFGVFPSLPNNTTSQIELRQQTNVVFRSPVVDVATFNTLFNNAKQSNNIADLLILLTFIGWNPVLKIDNVVVDINTLVGDDYLDNIDDYLTDQLLANQNKLGLNVGINDLVNLRTQNGVPLYVDNLGQVVLRDGRPFEGDLSDIVVSHNVPQVIDHAGTLTPTISTDFGVVNIRTGENIIPHPNPPNPNPTPNIKPNNTKTPTGIQRFLPVAAVLVFIAFLKAIVFYAIRLFEFILTLPLTPTKPIDNYALQWFMNAKILGIQVYDTVLAFATFAFSLTIYKVIRRIW